MANAFARPQYSDPNDLATAVRDVVHISRNGTSQPVPSSSSHFGGIAGVPRSASPHMPGAFHPSHSHSSSNHDIVAMSSKNRMAAAENPFAEPSEASVQFANTSSSSGAALLGTDNRDVDRDAKKTERRAERRERRQITQGQTKDAASKKGSRHADVIDTWDPTGLGSAMWHHSGPYDAAAPSRNLNQPRAPMQAFGLPGQPGGPPAAGTGAAAATVAAAAPVASAPAPAPAPAPVPIQPRTGPTAISLPPPVPPKTGEHDRRASAAARPTSGRRSSGGLSGQYSTSVPTSGGGYFGGEAPLEDEETAWRRRQREEKQRALKAAWGIDTPEPFEDFGFSPREDTIDLADPNDYPVGTVNNNNNRAARSPGLRLGSLGAPRSPPLPEEAAVSPTLDQPVGGFGSGAAGGRPGGGVKRTKSLMQKIKSMRDGSGGRSGSPSKNSSPGSEYPPMPVRPAATSNSAPTSASATGARNSPAKEYPPETYESAVEELEPEPLPLPSSSRIAGAEHYRRGSAPAFGPRKDLPSPPVGPVMPDFQDMVDHRRRVSAANADDAGIATVKRKTSVVKKFKDRVVKA